ncbi:MAG: response regulator [Candidatus Melainabacteria bacterium]|nr:response regulator [Candidatus Melainabacteria bacterium]
MDHQDPTTADETDQLRQRVAELEARVLEQERIIATHKRLENQVTQLHVLTAELKASSQRLVKARDQAVEASKFKSQFLANMSHEIRTPMNALIGVSDLMMKTHLSREQQEYANMIRDSASALLDIVNDILDFSKVEAGKVQLELCDLDLVHVVEGAAELLAEKAHQKKLSLMTFIQPQLERALRGDPTRLRQIILNLVSNAIKFTESGEIFVHAMSESKEGTEFVKVVIKDSGIGMSPEVQKQIFSPFTQADNSVSRKYGGTGLGLSICNKLVELMGGEIGLESQEGKGTTIWFTFPLEKANEQTPVEIPDGLAEIQILFVDGPGSSTKVMNAYAKHWGIKCDTAESSGVAHALLKSAHAKGQPYNIIVVESNLPDIRAEEFASQFAGEDYAGDTKIILFNSTGPSAAPKSFHDFSGYLTAPLRQSMLLDCILKISVKSQTEQKTTDTAPGVEPEKVDSGRHILIAEDNQVNQRVAVLQLQQIGFTADVVSNGEEAVEAANKNKYDLILMDCQMPIMDGFGATREIRKAEIRTGRRVPIVAMTAHAMEGDREKCIAEGMDDYISKPVNPTVLSAILEKWLQLQIVKPRQSAKEEVIPRRQWDPATEPPLDLEKLRELCPEDDDTRRMIDMFMTSAERLLKNLNIAIQDHDTIKIRSVAYEITGASNSVGAEELTTLGECLQRVCLEKNWTQCKILYETFRQALEVISDFSNKQEPVEAQV